MITVIHQVPESHWVLHQIAFSLNGFILFNWVIKPWPPSESGSGYKSLQLGNWKAALPTLQWEETLLPIPIQQCLQSIKTFLSKILQKIVIKDWGEPGEEHVIIDVAWKALLDFEGHFERHSSDGMGFLLCKSRVYWQHPWAPQYHRDISLCCRHCL